VKCRISCLWIRQLAQAAAAKGMALAAVEKDFWVCWSLSRLFTLPGIGEQLTFKGGTSLSKAWQLIQRFSEDLDLVMDRAWLGIGEDQDPETAGTPSQRKQRIRNLKRTGQERVSGAIRPALKRSFGEDLPKGSRWSLEMDPADRDQQTLLFNYPRLAAGDAEYLRAQVKIELGTRSDIFYDVAKLIQAGVGQRALADRPLFARVVAHRRVYFEKSGVDYDRMAQRNLRLVPEDSQMEAWRRDYEDMQREMFYGTPPAWSEVIQAVRAWEHAFNNS
jgi:hypothetical protein